MLTLTFYTAKLLNIKGAYLNQFLELHNILSVLTSMCVKMYYFKTKCYFESKHVLKKQPRRINSFLWLHCLVFK